jgi:hypothetical protein
MRGTDITQESFGSTSTVPYTSSAISLKDDRAESLESTQNPEIPSADRFVIPSSVETPF